MKTISRKLWLNAAAVLLGIVVFFAAALFAGAGSYLALDPRNVPIYQNIEAENILGAYQTGDVMANRTFGGKYYVVWGEVHNKVGEWTSFSLEGTSGQGEILCKTDSSTLGKEYLELGERVKVYGKIKVTEKSGWNLWEQPGVSMYVQKVEKASSSKAQQSNYSLLDGTVKSESTMVSRSLADGAFTYKIPRAWEAVEYELPNVTGYQYKLNQLSGKGKAESLFLFYVDGSYLERAGDISKTTQVQKAIIRNILGNDRLKIRHDWSFLDSDIRISKLDADYASFTGYSGWYTDPNRRSHRVEFLFLPSDEKGVRVLLYVYNEGDCVNDILYMMRMMIG